MIILPKEKVVIITPPKCGSTSLHQHLCSVPGNFYVIGPPWGDKHTTEVPFDFKDYKIYTVLRMENERLVSLWKHHNRWNPHLTFDCFMDKVFKEQLAGFYTKPLHEFIVDGTINLWNIDEDLKKIGVDYGKIPHLHKAD